MTETIVIDMVLPGVGRIKRATGTTRKHIARKMRDMLHDLFEEGRLDLIVSVRDGQLTIMQLFNAHQRKELNKLPTAGTALPLLPTWAQWQREKECSEEHRRSIGKTIKYLDPSSDALVIDVAGLLERFRAKCKGKPQTFRLARSHCLAFVRATVKRSHPLYSAVAEVAPMKPSPQKIKHPATVAELKALALKMSYGDREILWALALTGMRPNEFWGNWVDGHEVVRILGTKTKGAVRLVPRVTWLLPPKSSYTVFRKLLNKASDGQMSVYDLRRTYATWLEQAGIPRTRRRLYLGHGNSDVTDLYEAVEVKQFLAEDAAKLRAFVGESEPGLRIAK